MHTADGPITISSPKFPMSVWIHEYNYGPRAPSSPCMHETHNFGSMQYIYRDFVIVDPYKKVMGRGHLESLVHTFFEPSTSSHICTYQLNNAYPSQSLHS